MMMTHSFFIRFLQYNQTANPSKDIYLWDGKNTRTACITDKMFAISYECGGIIKQQNKDTSEYYYFLFLLFLLVIEGLRGEVDKRITTFPQMTLPVVFRHFSHDVDVLDIDAQGSDVGKFLHCLYLSFDFQTVVGILLSLGSVIRRVKHAY
jgi:hypothetical protein